MRLRHLLARLGLAFIASAPLASSAGVLAEPGVEAARSHFRSGLEQAQRGDWTGALSAFTSAYQLAPGANALFNLAGAQARCGKLLASNNNYRRLLASDDAGLTRAQRALVEQQIQRIETRIPRLRIQAIGLRADDRLVLDQARLYPDELARDLWVDPGTHLLQIFRAHGRPETRTIVVSEGELRVVALTFP
jgi:hypothetical protein